MKALLLRNSRRHLFSTSFWPSFAAASIRSSSSESQSGRLSRQGQRQSDRRYERDRPRLEVARPGIHRPEIFSSAPFRRGQRLRRRQFQRQQSRADFAKAEGRDQGSHCGLSSENGLNADDCSRRRGDRVRQRTRSAHQPAQRRAAGPARRADTEDHRGQGSRTHHANTEGPDSVFLATLESMLSG